MSALFLVILVISSTAAVRFVQLQLVLSPPHTPQLSTVLPKQSHASSAMPSPPQIPHSSFSKLEPHSSSQPEGPASPQPQPKSTLPSQSHASSAMPPPPHTPHSSNSKLEPQTLSQPEGPFSAA